MSRVLLIDGGWLAFTAAAGAERPFDWGDGLWTLHADLNAAKARIERTVEELVADLKADQVAIAVSCPAADNFRLAISPDYKANYRKARLPIILRPLQEFVLETYGGWSRPRLEADDVLGILATHDKSFPGMEKIIVGVDKDLRSIPGTQYHPATQERSEVSLQEADRAHLYQTLVGDTADNYPGCPGVGPVAAERILSEGGGWPEVVAAYEKKGLTEADALVQARLARILRAEDYDFKNKEPILWTPSTSPATTPASGPSPSPSSTPGSSASTSATP